MLISPSLRLRLAEFALTAIIAVALFAAWRADRRDRAQLTSEVAATKQLLAAANARQHDRDAQLAQTLAALAAEKRRIVTPAQIVRELPRQVPLPAPIALHTSPLAAAATSPVQPGQLLVGREAPPADAKPAQTNAVIPTQDLKPLYDFTLDCKACQASLAASQRDLADEKAKTAALSRERDQALQLARGGRTWSRITRAARWFLIGAAAGAVAAKTTH